jgi:hypothetical protein
MQFTVLSMKNKLCKKEYSKVVESGLSFCSKKDDKQTYYCNVAGFV